MSTQNKLLWIIGLLAGAAVALYLGVSPGTLLIIGALLLCPAAMYFGMRGMGQHGVSRPSGRDHGSNKDNSKTQPTEEQRQTQKKQ